MKETFAFLFPPARTLRPGSGALDPRGVAFPLELLKKYEPLFARFGVSGRGSGPQAVFQAAGGQEEEEYAIECVPGRVVVSAAPGRAQFYALSTLLQILAFHLPAGAMPAFALRDAPAAPFRGAALFRCEAAGDEAALRRAFLQLALLRFNRLALPVGAAGERAAAVLAPLARRFGLELWLLDADRDALGLVAPAGPLAAPVRPGADAPAAGDPWLEFFLNRCREAREAQASLTAWSERFLERPERVRRIPREALILNRGDASARNARFAAAARAFSGHHVRQVLCPRLCGAGRFLPDGRGAMAGIEAACAAAAAARLPGVLLLADGDDASGCLPGGAALARFQAGCRLWSGRASAPAAFGRWALGRDEPDLFRVASFLAQAEGRLPRGHERYLFEDPLLAPFSRLDDPRRVVAHYRKAVQYLGKREIDAGDLGGFLAFAARLFAVIAAKVEFSARLGALLAEDGRELASRASALEGDLAGLGDLYVALGAAPHPGAGRDFDRLLHELAELRRAAATAAGRAGLLEKRTAAAALDPEDAASY
jgi:hypothetical protein